MVTFGEDACPLGMGGQDVLELGPASLGSVPDALLSDLGEVCQGILEGGVESLVPLVLIRRGSGEGSLQVQDLLGNGHVPGQLACGTQLFEKSGFGGQLLILFGGDPGGKGPRDRRVLAAGQWLTSHAWPLGPGTLAP